MAISQTITALPTPPDPATDDEVTFPAKAQAFTIAQAAMGVEQNTLASQMNTLAAEVESSLLGTFGVADLPTGANIASASTVNLNAATGNRVHITGTTTITAVTLTRGPRTVIFDGALTLTHHATNNNLPGAANITTVAGDRAIYESDGTTVYCVGYFRKDGTPVVAGSAAASTVIAVADVDVSGAVAAVDFTSGIGSTYSSYTLRLENVTPATGSARIVVQTSTDGGSSWDAGTGYSVGERGIRVSTSGAINYSSTGAAWFELDGANGTSNTTADGGVSGEFTIINPASTTRQKQVTFQITSGGGSSDVYTTHGGGQRLTTTAVNGLRVKASTGNIASGRVILEGNRKSV